MMKTDIDNLKKSLTADCFRAVLLFCGIIASLLYAAMNVFIPLHWQAYSSVNQTVSELSAIGAPTRPIWVVMGIPYTLLMVAFGLGIRLSAYGNRYLRAAGNMIIVYGILGLFWPPMHLRGAGFSLTDTMHIIFAMATVFMMLLSVIFAAVASGKKFRIYSLLTLVIFLGFGILTALEAPHIAANEPTPLIGVWERINIGVFLLWIVVLAVSLLHPNYNYKYKKTIIF